MKNQLGFLLKLLLLSALISLLIKYAAPTFLIPETSTNALILVLLPTVIMITILLLRIPAQKQN
ncbi:hypothetical protein [Trichormus variabilis]|uniref:Uncharacterized protein n=1 Tax=Trichormus variabilis SAG 1403-4b TaxID=447716 RepID=A0A3S1CA14_ANAVA|nr:hypothetical protein [Trichormus variabilis]RUS99573.1 hypothetical protein DSM107003_01570 [Trichormus variabilis SAG 1403-4b]